MKEQELKKKRLAFLEDTVNHYNSGNRCSFQGSCKYSPKTLNLEGKTEGCAIGRHLTKELASELDKNSKCTVKFIFHQLPSELQTLGVDFLLDVQCLHDVSDNWDENGISRVGGFAVSNIKAKYELP